MITCANTENNGEMKWGLNWFFLHIPQPLYSNYPFVPALLTNAFLVHISNRLGLHAPLNDMFSQLMEKILWYGRWRPRTPPSLWYDITSWPTRDLLPWISVAIHALTFVWFLCSYQRPPKKWSPLINTTSLVTRTPDFCLAEIQILDPPPPPMWGPSGALYFLYSYFLLCDFPIHDILPWYVGVGICNLF